MEFEEFLNKQVSLIDKRLNKILESHSQELGQINLQLRKLFKEFIKVSQGGKRIRGALVLLGYQIGGGKDFTKVLDAGVSYEVFQTAILSQDDVIDESLLRRGKPSLYAALGGEHRGISETICLSDLGFFIAYKLVSDLGINPEYKIRAINVFSNTQINTVNGQILDIETPYFKDDFAEKDILKIALLKTARYTISGPLTLGATLAGVDSETLEDLKKFGDNIGIAFQIQDDILGIFGEEKITGKSNSSDIRENKATLLISFAQKKADEQQRKVLKKYYGNSETDEKGIEEVRKVLRETGALDYAASRSEKYFEEAKRILISKKSLKEADQGLLYSLVDYIKGRQK